MGKSTIYNMLNLLFFGEYPYEIQEIAEVERLYDYPLYA